MRGWVWAFAAMSAAIAAFGVLVIVAVVSGGRTIIADLEVGDCFNVSDEIEDAIEFVDPVACDAPHLFEVVGDGVLDTSGGALTDEQLFAEIDEACRALGVVSSGRYGLLPVAPTPERWERGDGRFLCVAIPFGGAPVVGSATDA